jgi:hypothetical protein
MCVGAGLIGCRLMTVPVWKVERVWKGGKLRKKTRVSMIRKFDSTSPCFSLRQQQGNTRRQCSVVEGGKANIADTKTASLLAGKPATRRPQCFPDCKSPGRQARDEETTVCVGARSMRCRLMTVPVL